MTAKVIQVIETDLLKRGDGKTTILRGVKQYWSLDGKLLAEVDPCAGRSDKVEDYQAQQYRAKP